MVSTGLMLPKKKLVLPEYTVYPHKRISCESDFDGLKDEKIMRLRAKLVGEFYQVLYPVPRESEFNLFIGSAYETLDYLFERLREYQRFMDLFKGSGGIRTSRTLLDYLKESAMIPGALEELNDEDFKKFDEFIVELNSSH